MEKANHILTRTHHKLCIYAVCTIAVMAFIFAMSSSNGEESSSLSGPIAKALLILTVPEYDSLALVEQERLFDLLTFIVRKTAHITEYAVLALCVTATARQAEAFNYLKTHSELPRASWNTMWIGITICVAYAASDEFHQLFVADRTGLPTDVLIDSVGIVLAACLATAIARRERERC